MVNKQYNKGYRFEQEVKHFLEKQGFLVFRSAGSHSPVDLIAFRQTYKIQGVMLKPFFIQCKATQSTYIPRKELKQYLAFSQQWQTPLYVVFPRKCCPFFTVVREQSNGKPILEPAMWVFVGKTMKQIREELEKEGKKYE